MNYKIIKTSSYELDIFNIINYLKNEFVDSNIIKNFLEEIIGTINSLDFMPERYEKVYKDHRRVLVKNYSIFYKVDKTKKQVIIYRILHQSQNFSNLLD